MPEGGAYARRIPSPGEGNGRRPDRLPAEAAMMPGMTLLLSRSDLEQVLDVRACLEVLRQGFLAPAPAIVPQRVRTDLPGPGTATVLLPGLVPDLPAYSVKVNAKFPRSRPALRGLVCLHDTGTGE